LSRHTRELVAGWDGTGIGRLRGRPRPAALQVIRDACPDWRVWTDKTGWHAMRRGDFFQDKKDGSLAHSLHEPTSWDLVAALVRQAYLDVMEQVNV
jgi:hypothetical protein